MAEKKRLYLTKVVRHYNKLFTFPKYWALLLLLLLVCLSGSSIAFAMIRPDSKGVVDGLIFALQVLFFPTILVDIISSNTFAKAEAVFNLRRSTSLSLVICSAWAVIMAMGGILQAFFRLPQALYYATFFSICVIAAMRFLVLSTVAQLSRSRLILAIVVQPLVLFTSNMVFWDTWSQRITVATLISSTVLILASQLLIRIVNRQGEVVVGIGAIPLFKGFLANWLEDFTYPLERYFEKLGTDTDVSVNIFAFRGKDKLKAVMVIPNIHPGPFRNLGSSTLPDMIQRSLETKFATITAVPHGLSGHELDLTSQSQCDKVIREILKVEPSNFFARASKASKIDTGLANAICQFFGETALVTVTCAPKSMEDIPLDAGAEIVRKGKQLGAKEVAVIDAHNSIGGTKEVPTLSEEETRGLVSAAEEALNVALKEERQPFLVGVAKVVPDEFTIGQGMGPGGIIALAVIVNGQKTLYVTIDGNNMVSGLREKIIQAVSDRFDVCEVLTTDTHIVNAISMIERGYYPVGEAVDHERLISLIKDAAVKAMDGAEEVEVSFTRVHISNVRVIGEEKLVNLSMLIDLTFSLLKRVAPLIYVPAFIVAILPFIFIR